MVFFTFPDDACWNADRRAVEFGIAVGDYQGRVFVPRALFQALLTACTCDEETCLAAFHAHRMIFERAAETRVTRRHLDGDGHITLKSTDLLPNKNGLPD